MLGHVNIFPKITIIAHIRAKYKNAIQNLFINFILDFNSTLFEFFTELNKPFKEAKIAAETIETNVTISLVTESMPFDSERLK